MCRTETSVPLNSLYRLFDTDGSICRHHKNSGAIIEISSGDPQFLTMINNSLKRLGFKTSLGKRGVKIYAKKEIDLFFKKVKPANQKHQKRYKTFKKRDTIQINMRR